MSGTIIGRRADRRIAGSRPEARRPPAWSVALGRGVLSLAGVLAAWAGLIWALQLPGYLAKGPVEVWEYLVTGVGATDHREALAAALSITLRDASIGLTAGLGFAAMIAIAFTLSPGLSYAFMPVAMLLTSVPLVAMAPLIILIAGRSTLVVAVLGTLIVFFPALVMLVRGLQSAPPGASDVVAVGGGGRARQLALVRLPSAIPAFFVVVRMSMPAAITGALIAEWLATGEGLGNTIPAAIGVFRITEVWASAAVITAVSILLYNLVEVVEAAVVPALGFERRR